MHIEEFYENSFVENDFDETYYQDRYPDTKEFCQPYCRDNNISDRKRLFFHYATHKRELILYKNLLQQKRQELNYLNIKIENQVIHLENERSPWQIPASTEKLYFYNHIFQNLKDSNSKDSNYYVAFPWATLIDKGLIFSDKCIEYIHNVIASQKGNKHTVCQHIKWKKLVLLWQDIGITDVHISHCEKSTRDTDKIKFHSCPLMAANYENADRSDGLIIKENKDKKYLASFIGAHAKLYRGNVRLELKKLLKNQKNIIYEIKDEWFYDKIVYHMQVNNAKLSKEYFIEYQKETKRYNEVLSDSIFSLCPEGTGPNTIRLWESMSIGVVPVIFSDDWLPPKIGDLDWHDFSIIINKEDLTSIVPILNYVAADKIEQMKINCLNAYKQFKQLTFFNSANYQTSPKETLFF